LSFVVLAVTGIRAFVRPLSFGVVGPPDHLLIEVDQLDDDQPSLVCPVEIDNADPHAFQLLDLVGYPKREEDDSSGKEV